MTDRITKKIIAECTRIELEAAQLYDSFVSLTEDRKIRKFWGGMADEEREHISFWESLAELAKNRKLPDILDNPEETLEELEDINKKVEIFKKRYMLEPNLENAELLAFRIEFYLLHPVFASFFYYMKPILPGVDPASSYERHLARFVDSIATLGAPNSEIELLGETLQRMWKRNLELARQNSTDFLTGIYNRRGFFAAVKPLSHLSQRNSHNVGIMIADVDDFKKVNDSQGHEAGDTVLKNIAEIMRSSVRSSDLVARFGGEEFIIFLSTVDRSSVWELAENVRKNIESGTSGSIPVTVSIGVADGRLPRDVDQGFDKLIQRADKELYRAKAEGKNRVAYDRDSSGQR
ncbi:MAG: diguanylate cyclase [Candidatus Krumholzibacteriota bacterium]|nr:diguanylate cyclase [Candidatus Krumholzibacteriota bacterium]